MPQGVLLIANMAACFGTKAVNQDSALTRAKLYDRFNSVFRQKPEQEIQQGIACRGTDRVKVILDTAIKALLCKYVLKYLLVGTGLRLLQDVPVNKIDKAPFNEVGDYDLRTPILLLGRRAEHANENGVGYSFSESALGCPNTMTAR